MVSPNDPSPILTTETMTTNDRGIRDQSYGVGHSVSSQLLYGPSLIGRYGSFWGSVFAGTFIAIALSVLLCPHVRVPCRAL